MQPSVIHSAPSITLLSRDSTHESISPLSYLTKFPARDRSNRWPVCAMMRHRPLHASPLFVSHRQASVCPHRIAKRVTLLRRYESIRSLIGVFVLRRLSECMAEQIESTDAPSEAVSEGNGPRSRVSRICGSCRIATRSLRRCQESR